MKNSLKSERLAVGSSSSCSPAPKVAGAKVNRRLGRSVGTDSVGDRVGVRVVLVSVGLIVGDLVGTGEG